MSAPDAYRVAVSVTAPDGREITGMSLVITTELVAALRNTSLLADELRAATREEWGVIVDAIVADQRGPVVLDENAAPVVESHPSDR